ncbi:MAG: hypothetical protein MK116_11755 [Phycisphaerales bacterium]|nr:hypothetical protein [Phycisphaerales bacterium]
MNPINAASAASMLPLPTSRLVATAPCPPASAPVSAAPAAVAPVPPQGIAGPVNWSPGLWWLLHRYEYLFIGLLPTLHASTPGAENMDPPGPILESARPHWDETSMLNPPPAAATIVPAPQEGPLVPQAVNPQVVGTVVDLLA